MQNAELRIVFSAPLLALTSRYSRLRRDNSGSSHKTNRPLWLTATSPNLGEEIKLRTEN